MGDDGNGVEAQHGTGGVVHDNFYNELLLSQTANSNNSTCFNLQESKDLLAALTGDNFFVSLLTKAAEAIGSDRECIVGYFIYKSATSPEGVSIEKLASFATLELRMRNIEYYFREMYGGKADSNTTTTSPSFLLRERQDLKVRYEVMAAEDAIGSKSKEGLKITQIFASVEAKKDTLMLADYSVSQTSLEQVFNLKAEEAAKAVAIEHS